MLYFQLKDIDAETNSSNYRVKPDWDIFIFAVDVFFPLFPLFVHFSFVQLPTLETEIKNYFWQPPTTIVVMDLAEIQNKCLEFGWNTLL